MASTRKVDEQGRVALPSRWRERELRGSDEVVIVEREGGLLIVPRPKVDLTAYFDKAVVDVDPSTFADYASLRRELTGRRGKAEVR